MIESRSFRDPDALLNANKEQLTTCVEYTISQFAYKWTRGCEQCVRPFVQPKCPIRDPLFVNKLTSLLYWRTRHVLPAHPSCSTVVNRNAESAIRDVRCAHHSSLCFHSMLKLATALIPHLTRGTFDTCACKTAHFSTCQTHVASCQTHISTCQAHFTACQTRTAPVTFGTCVCKKAHLCGRKEKRPTRFTLFVVVRF